MTEESPSKIKIKKVAKIVDTVVRFVLIISFTIALYLITAVSGEFIDSQPLQVVLIGAIVINSLLSLAIYCRMD